MANAFGVALPKLFTDSTRAGRLANRSRNVHFRSNQMARDHMVNFEDTSLGAATFKKRRGSRRRSSSGSTGNGSSVGGSSGSSRRAASTTKPKHVRVGNELMKRTGEKNVQDFERRAARRARLLRKQRIVFLFARIQNRAVEKIQNKVRDFLSWRQGVKRERAATFLAGFYRRLKTRRVWRDLANGAGQMRARVLDGLCGIIQRRTRVWLWKKARTAGLRPLQRLVHSHVARVRTARRLEQRRDAMARRVGRWARRRLRALWRARQRSHESAEAVRQQRREAAEREAAKQKRIAKRLHRQQISKITYARKQFLLETRAHYSMGDWLKSRGLTTTLEPHPELRLSSSDDDGGNDHGDDRDLGADGGAGSDKQTLLSRNPCTGSARPGLRRILTHRRPHTADSDDVGRDAARGAARGAAATSAAAAEAAAAARGGRSISPRGGLGVDVGGGSAGPGAEFVPEGVEDWVDFFMTNERWSVESSKIRGMELSFTMLEESRRKKPGTGTAGGAGGGDAAAPSRQGGRRGGQPQAQKGKPPRTLFASVNLTEVWQLFRTMDVDRNGQVSPKEFQAAMAQLGEDFTDAEVAKVFAFVDTNDSGGISIAELQAAMAIYQRKYSNVVERRKKFGKAQTVMKQIYAKRLGGHVRDELNEAIEQGSQLAARFAAEELEELRRQAEEAEQRKRDGRRRRKHRKAGPRRPAFPNASRPAFRR